MAGKRILSGMQPSGQLHLGNYHGALKNWIAMQDDFDCFFFIADLHSLTTLYENPQLLKKYSFEVAVDWLSSGLDPENVLCLCNLKFPNTLNYTLFFQ